MMSKILNWIYAIVAIIVAVWIIFAVTTSAHGQLRPIQLWTLWQTDEHGVPLKALLRFTSLDGCIGASYRHGLTTGETATCLPYHLGDFR